MRPPSRTRNHPWARPIVEPEADRLLAETVSSERELKYRLDSPEDFAKVLRAASPEGAPRPVIQRNHIFDTPDRALAQAGYRLRLREEDGRWLLTAKGQQLKSGPHAKDAARSRPEVEISVAPELARAMVQGDGSPIEHLAGATELSAGDRAFVVALADRFEGAPLQHVGSFLNERFKIPWSSPEPESIECLLEIDRTQFPGGIVNFEMEVELSPEANSAMVDAALRRWLDDVDVAPKPSSGKIKRFFEALDTAPTPRNFPDRFS